MTLMTAVLARAFTTALAMAPLAALTESRAEDKPILTAVAVAALASPRPFAGSDGLTHLAYELTIVNTTKLFVRLDDVMTLDADTGAALGQWSGRDLEAVFRINGGDKGVVLGPSQSAIVFLDATIPLASPSPVSIRHRISTTRMSQAPGNDPGRSAPIDPSLGIPASVTFETATTPVDNRPAIRLAPPLKGPGWIAVNGCCDSITSHRGAVMAFNGVMLAPERFAIDFVQFDSERRLFTGPQEKLGSYAFFGVPVHAVADGVVVGVEDGMAEAVPGAAPAGITIETAAGNHVVLDIGGGNFALYAHLETGSLRIKKGDHVKQGDVLGQLGNTGNTDAPHLHFHVMNGPFPLASSGLPYVFDRFGSTGRLVLDDSFFAGRPGVLDQNWHPGDHEDQLPLNNAVIDFPE
jgi:hypothetical protein